MICGQSDKICQSGDYMALKEILQRQNSLIDFLDTGFGHLSILNPRFSEFFDELSEKDKKDSV
jgi:hypothetical protein